MVLKSHCCNHLRHCLLFRTHKLMPNRVTFLEFAKTCFEDFCTSAAQDAVIQGFNEQISQLLPFDVSLQLKEGCNSGWPLHLHFKCVPFLSLRSTVPAMPSISTANPFSHALLSKEYCMNIPVRGKGSWLCYYLFY